MVCEGRTEWGQLVSGCETASSAAHKCSAISRAVYSYNKTELLEAVRWECTDTECLGLSSPPATMGFQTSH